MKLASLSRDLSRHSLVRFLLVGGLGTGTNLLVFFLMVDVFGWGATRTSVLAFAVSVSQNYFLNHRVSFPDKGDDKVGWRAYLRYVAVNLVGLGVSLVVMNSLLFLFDLKPRVLAQFFGIGAATVLNYWGAKHIVFHRRLPGGSATELEQPEPPSTKMKRS